MDEPYEEDNLYKNKILRLLATPTNRTTFAFIAKRHLSIKLPKEKFNTISPVIISREEGLFHRKNIRLKTTRINGRNLFSAKKNTIIAVGINKNKNSSEVKLSEFKTISESKKIN